jgi:hypothetical protein
MFWWNLYVKDIPFFRKETFVANIEKKRDGVNGVNPVSLNYRPSFFWIELDRVR